MRYFLNSIILSVSITSLLVIGIGILYNSTAFAQGELTAEFGDWKVHCETPVGAKNEQCVMIQRLTSEQRPNISLQVILINTADSDTYIMRILAPLGVVLPSGLGLQVDNEEKGVVGFVRCIIEGCVAEVILSNELIRDFSNGEIATFVLFMTPEEGIGLPLKLDGFMDGLQTLNSS